MTSVGVIGGGIAGLTVADELSWRGYEVHVFESDPGALGGKAKSHGFRVQPGWKDLPAEHGFRFFPGFYANVIETMEHIPHPRARRVADRLVDARQLKYSFHGPDTGDIVAPLNFAELARTVAEGFWNLFTGAPKVDTPKLFSADDLGYLANLFWYVNRSSVEERLEMESTSFSTFTTKVFPLMPAARGTKPSATLEHFLTNAGTRMLVAAQPERMSARTGLVTLVRMLDPTIMISGEVDRLLAGPTSPEWFDPWVVDLRSNHDRTPVTFHMGRTVTALAVNGTKVTSFSTSPGNASHHFDHVVLAVPHGVAETLLAPHAAALPTSLSRLSSLTSDWMCGAQYYLDRRPQITAGHVMYVDSPWALTSVTQAQFWPDFPWADAGDGNVCDVLSVCVSNWDVPGLLHHKPAKQCTEQEIKEEVWHQMVTSLNDAVGNVLPVDHTRIVRAFHLDPGVTRDASTKVSGNTTPLYVNTMGSWHDRPPSDPGMDNLFLAGDWVRTNTDLATMEGASESGRRAANAILERDGTVPNVKVTAPDDLGLL